MVSFGIVCKDLDPLYGADTDVYLGVMVIFQGSETLTNTTDSESYSVEIYVFWKVQSLLLLFYNSSAFTQELMSAEQHLIESQKHET